MPTPARRSSPRSRRGRTLPMVVVAIAVLALGAVGGWWWMATGRLTLAGSVSHDFGTIAIEGDEALLRHQFILTNRRDEPVRIVAARASCGCAGVDYPDGAIEPGESVTLTGRLALEASGRRAASVALVLDNGESQRLFMEAVGRKQRLVRLEPSQIQLEAGGESQVLIQAQILREEDGQPVEPPTPEFEAPDGVRVEWRGWSLMTEGEPDALRADRWRGRVALIPTAEPWGVGTSLVVVLPAASTGGDDIRTICRIIGIRGLDAMGGGGPMPPPPTAGSATGEDTMPDPGN